MTREEFANLSHAFWALTQERKRQVEVCGHEPEHDRARNAPLAQAAAAYICQALGDTPRAAALWPEFWPYGDLTASAADPAYTRITRLIKAGALVLAEIEKHLNAGGLLPEEYRKKEAPANVSLNS